MNRFKPLLVIKFRLSQKREAAPKAIAAPAAREEAPARVPPMQGRDLSQDSASAPRPLAEAVTVILGSNLKSPE